MKHVTSGQRLRVKFDCFMIQNSTTIHSTQATIYRYQSNKPMLHCSAIHCNMRISMKPLDEII